MIGREIIEGGDALRTRYKLTKREAKSLVDAMFREVRAGGGKWFGSSNNRMFRVVNALSLERKKRGLERFKRKELSRDASATLRKALSVPMQSQSNLVKGANAEP
jgi:hypothetical protein